MSKVRTSLKFLVGCDFEEFKKYLERIGLYKEEGELEKLEALLMNGFFNLIVWRENDEIVGHAIWHETNTEEHRKGVLRDKEDREALKRLLGGRKDFVELHEVWLVEEHRGKGYGKRFFEFFEKFMRNKGYDSVIYYANHPAALAVCHKRGYKEGDYLKGIGEYVFCLRLRK